MSAPPPPKKKDPPPRPPCSISCKIMNSRASGAGKKRSRQQQVEGGRGEPALMQQVIAHPEPLTLLAVVKLFYGMLVWAQLCNSQGVFMFSFEHLPPRVPRPFAGVPVYNMSLAHAERLRVVDCGFKGRLVRLLSLGVGQHFEPQRNRGTCYKMMQSVVRRVISGLAAAVRDKVAKEAEELCASGQFAAAVVPLEQAMNWGDLPSRALYANLLMLGREGIDRDYNKGMELALEGLGSGCLFCAGVIAGGFKVSSGSERENALWLKMVQKSSNKGIKYGQLALGMLHDGGAGGLVQDYVQAVACYRLAAAQGLDEAQFKLGVMFYSGRGVVQDYAEAVRFFQLSAAQGFPFAFLGMGMCREYGEGVRQSKAAAIRWYRRAQAAGHADAANDVRRLSA